MTGISIKTLKVIVIFKTTSGLFLNSISAVIYQSVKWNTVPLTLDDET